MAGGEGLGHDFAEDEEQQGDAAGGDEDGGSPVVAEERDDDGGANGGGGGVDQVVAQEDGGEEALRVFRQPEDAPCTGDAGADQVHEADSLEGKEGGFRAGEEGGNGEEEDQEAKF